MKVIPPLHFIDIKDDISHFLLRIVYCRPTDQKFFIDNEVRLLKFRFENTGTTDKSKEVIQTFVQTQGLDFQVLSPSSRALYWKDLDAVGKSFYNGTIHIDEQFYEVHFF